MTPVDIVTVPAWIEGHLVAVEKMRVHRAGLRHKAVSVFVLSDDKVLLQKRAAGKYHTPSLWTNTCCTHPRWGEAARDCATRRLAEEMGIKDLNPEPRGQVEYRADVGRGLTEHEVVDLFVAHAREDLPLTPDPEEVADVRWAALADLRRDVAARPERYTPWLRIYLDRDSRSIFGAAS